MSLGKAQPCFPLRSHPAPCRHVPLRIGRSLASGPALRHGSATMRPSISRTRQACLLAAAFLCVLCPTLPSSAQVSVDQGALDSLGSPAAPARVAPAARLPAPERHPPTRRDTRSLAKPRTPPPRPPVIPVAPPPKAALPPAEPTVPTRPTPPPPVPVVPDAPDTVGAIPGGMRVTFGADRSDLNPATVSALRDLARTVKADPAATLDVNAWSAGTPDDPSTPRRLSLARALAVRAVLISEGIASPRIYVRALGTDGGDTPDRAEITRTVVAATLPAAPAAGQPAPQTGPGGKPAPSASAPTASAPAASAGAATPARKR